MRPMNSCLLASASGKFFLAWHSIELFEVNISPNRMSGRLDIPKCNFIELDRLLEICKGVTIDAETRLRVDNCMPLMPRSVPCVPKNAVEHRAGATVQPKLEVTSTLSLTRPDCYMHSMPSIGADRPVPANSLFS